MNIAEAVGRSAGDLTESGTGSCSGTQLTTSLFSQLIQEKKEEFIVKLKTGTTEPSYQIGAGSYTEKEWDKIIKGFDKAEEALRKAAGLDEDKPKKTSGKEKAENKESGEKNTPEEVASSILTSETTSCTYPSSKPEEEDMQYITCYQVDGIFCWKKGQSEMEWEIKLDESQYEKVMAFLNRFDSKENLRFACHENFWQDFLDDKIDIEDFMNYLDSKVVNGVPQYAVETENGTYIDREAVKYCWYMNEPGLFNLIATTSEEFFEYQRQQIEKLESERGDDWVAWYYRKHPDEVGKRNMEYQGKLYTMEELYYLWTEEVSELFGQAK